MQTHSTDSEFYPRMQEDFNSLVSTDPESPTLIAQMKSNVAFLKESNKIFETTLFQLWQSLWIFTSRSDQIPITKNVESSDSAQSLNSDNVQSIVEMNKLHVKKHQELVNRLCDILKKLWNV